MERRRGDRWASKGVGANLRFGPRQQQNDKLHGIEKRNRKNPRNTSRS